MKLSAAPSTYSESDQTRLRQMIEKAFDEMYARGESIELHPGASVITRSPDQTRWKLQVSNAGVLSAVLA